MQHIPTASKVLRCPIGVNFNYFIAYDGNTHNDNEDTQNYASHCKDPTLFHFILYKSQELLTHSYCSLYTVTVNNVSNLLVVVSGYKTQWYAEQEGKNLQNNITVASRLQRAPITLYYAL